jgi:bacterioferritin
MDQKQEIIKGLQKAYWMEMETVMNYMANAYWLDGLKSEEIKKLLKVDIAEEITHAETLAKRIRELDGRVQGSMEFVAAQETNQPPADSTNVTSVIKGVIDAENGAIAHYNNLIKLCDGFDYVTQDLLITLLADEENHLREFIGFLREFEKMG